MHKIILKNGRIIDPSRNMDEIGAVIIKGEHILASGQDSLGYTENAKDTTENFDEIIDCTGKAIFPGLIDMRVFINSLYYNKGETIESASRAACAGGITSFALMPDKDMPMDNLALLALLHQKIKQEAKVKILPVGAISKNLEGKELSEFGLLQERGIVALSEGKKTLADSAFLYKAMLYAKNFNLPFFHETQEHSLSQGGVATESLQSNWLGLSGILREAEAIALARDLYLARSTGVHYHAAQISTKLSLDLLEREKQNNPNISAAVSINHLTFNEYDSAGYNTAYALCPPLRFEEDRLAMIEGIKNGLINAIVSSHEPQSLDKKQIPFACAAPGAIGLETIFSATLRLYHEGFLSALQVIDLLSTKPAGLLNLEAGSLKAGSKADLVIADLEEPWVLKKENLHSKARNTCFDRATFQGKIKKTFINGKIVFSENG